MNASSRKEPIENIAEVADDGAGRQPVTLSPADETFLGPDLSTPRLAADWSDLVQHPAWSLLSNASILFLLLPLAGFFVRLVAFSMDPAISSPARIALALGIGEMAFAGLVAFAITVPGLIVTALLFARDAPKMQAIAAASETVEQFRSEVATRRAGLIADRAMRNSPKASAKWIAEALANRIEEDQRLVEVAEADLADAEAAAKQVRDTIPKTRLERFLARRPIRWVGRVVAVIAIALAPAFPAILLLVAVGLVVYAALRRIATSHGRLPVTRTLPWLLVGMIGGGFFWGLTYPVEAAAMYEFQAAAGLPPGWYSRLGSADDLVFLKACDDGRVLGVSSALMAKIAFPSSASYLRRLNGPSLVEAVAAGRPPTVGARYRCP